MEIFFSENKYSFPKKNSFLNTPFPNTPFVQGETKIWLLYCFIRLFPVFTFKNLKFRFGHDYDQFFVPG